MNNASLPVNPLHWDGALDVDSVNTWDNNFKHFRSVGQTRWSPPLNHGPRQNPGNRAHRL